MFKNKIASIYLLILWSTFLTPPKLLAQNKDDVQTATSDFKALASRIPMDEISKIPLQSQGRVKSFKAFSRESMLFISGKYKPLSLQPEQTYLSLMIFDRSPLLELINVRDPELRVVLGLEKLRNHFTLSEIEQTKIWELAKAAYEKAQINDKSLTPQEKNIQEVYQQTALLREILSGQQFFRAIDFHSHPNEETRTDSPVVAKAQEFLQNLGAASTSQVNSNALELRDAIAHQEDSSAFSDQINKIGAEVFYLKLQPFFWAALLYILLGIILIYFQRKDGTQKLAKWPLIALSLPFILQVIGFSIRIHVTGFAPVTNMYGTMLWVSFGVICFSAILYYIYKNLLMFGLLVTSAGALLLLTESIPLVLSPDMDPIVAVLRSNYWLSIHVLTITISYAAFTISMLIGNFALIGSLFKKANINYKELARHAYRVIQLGVFLLTAGIILGGIWADYSWGRFWGWDPKETWALIADLGFIALLHARHVGWLKDFGLLALSPLAYLLVIMAWYGVNFILAAGLHSYGFSSGGTAVVVIFVSAQLAVLAAAWAIPFIKVKLSKGA